MLKKDFWYDLPKELIAQEPADPRDAARLMVLDRKNDKILHSVFHELPHYLEKGDLLVVNNSKVLPARLMGTKVPTGAVCELLLLRQVKGDTWECLARPGKRMQPGTKVEFGDGSLTAVVDETLPDGNKYVTFTYDTETLYEKLDEFGKMPLPPYITKQLEDQSQYQTVYAKELGSAAAPTAGHRVIAVGTTSCRTLESVWAKYGKIVPCSGNTSIFIYPGIELKAIDGLITNFHLPESTLIMLIAAFYGYDKTMAAYKVAVEEKYRFFSFGDAMFIR